MVKPLGFVKIRAVTQLVFNKVVVDAAISHLVPDVGSKPTNLPISQDGLLYSTNST